MTFLPPVVIRVSIPGPVYRRLSVEAKARRLPDVGALLERIATEQAKTPAETRRNYRHIDGPRLALLEKMYAEGISQKVIQETLGVSRSAVQSHVRRIRNRYTRQNGNDHGTST